MDTATSEWWRRHAWVILILAVAFTLTFILRTMYMYPLIQQWGPLYVYGGGSDSFYHSRVTSYIILNHANLVRDGALNYPLGAVNPREPLFDWMNAMFGLAFAPLFGGSAIVAGAWFLVFAGPFWAALSVIPIYLIGREVSSSRMGLIAALLWPLMVSSIDSSTFGYANYLSFYTFFILIFVYSFLRTVKAAGTRRWVESYGKPRQFPAAIRGFFRTERTAVKWAVLSGVSLGALALAWQGYTFAIAIVVIFLIFALIVERLRRVDSFGMYISLWIIGLIAFPMAVPYYLPQGLFAGWFDLPLLLYFGALLVALPFLMLRDSPWVVSLPVLIGVGLAALGTLYLVDKNFFTNIVTGQGYFVKTLVYQTVAEAQAPSIDALIIGYGVAMIWIAFIGLGFYIYSTIRLRFRRVQILFIVFAAISFYLPFSAAKFLYLGSAAFALLPAETFTHLLDVGHYPQLRRDLSSLTDRRSQFFALRRSLKLRHFLVLALAFALIFPSVWYSVDAAIPYNSKSTFAQQIYYTLPPALRGTNPNASLGAAGTELDTPNQYDSAGYNWLATQDTNLPPLKRPAFISWWDYGFQAVDQGQHPTVADNFQNGIAPGGNFLLAQNESLAIAVLTTRLLTAEQVASGNPYLTPELNAILTRDGVNVEELHNLMVNTSGNIPRVLANPTLYLPYNESNLDETNALYAAVSYFLAGGTTTNGMAQIYGDVEAYTGWQIQYVMVDNRLFPFTGSNTGIFYAPAQLTGRIIGAGGAPVTYYTLSVTGSDGNTYVPGKVPSGVGIVQYNIHRYAPFYNSMIYRTFIGYNGTDVGLGTGIPGLEGSNAVVASPIEPAWMMEHFQVLYRTAYYCPYSNPSGHSGCFSATNLPQAQLLQKRYNGTADTSPSAYFQGGTAFLQYYNGQPLVGTVRTSSGTPVSQARVTVYDGFGIPHMTNVTGPTGAYSIILPPGNVTVNVTTGNLDLLTQAGTTLLSSSHFYVPPAAALRPNAPTLVMPITLQPATVNTFTYWNLANNTSYDPAKDEVVSGATVSLWGHGLMPITAITDASGTATLTGVPPGVYNYSVKWVGWNYTGPQLTLTPGLIKNQSTPLSPASVSGTVHMPGGSLATGAIVTVTGASGVIGTAVTNLTGRYSVSQIPPGNYSISAGLPGASLTSEPAFVGVTSPGQKLSQNLSLQTSVHVVLTVLANGAPVSGFAVRFSPIPSLEVPPTVNGTPPSHPGPPQTAANLNSTVFLTDANGVVVASLPSNDYSVYGLGLIGSTWYAGFKSVYVAQAAGSLVLPPLVLTAAVRLAGTTVLTQGASPSGPTLVTAYTPRGDQVYTIANGSGTWALWVPSGAYTIAAVEGANTAHVTVYAALENITTSQGPIDLTLSTGARLSAIVGVPTSTAGHGFQPASGAVAQLSLSNAGGVMTDVANASGNITFIAPIQTPSGASYCLTVVAPGFEPLHQCGIAGASLGGITNIPLAVTPVPVTLTVVGLPTGTSLTVNLTANSTTAQSLTVKGGPTFNLTVHPGLYVLTAWAPSPSPPGLLLPRESYRVNVPIGAPGVNVTIFVVSQVPSVGSLVLPAGTTNQSAEVRLQSPVMNLTLPGPLFEHTFFAAPGTYHAYATATGPAGAPYSDLSTFSINRTGVPSGPIVLTASGVNLTGRLVQPTGFTLSTNTTLGLMSPAGANVATPVVQGHYSVVVPPGVAFTPVVNVTELVNTIYGPRYETFRPVAGASCTGSTPATLCNISLSSTPILTHLTGTFQFGGFPATFPGTVRFVGPLPARNVSLVPVGASGFAWDAVPGTYSVYASTGSGPGTLANVSQLSIQPTAQQSVTFALSTTWVAQATVTAPGNSGITQANLWIHGPAGVSMEVDALPVSTPFSIALPSGVYTLEANASASPYGVETPATAVAVVSLLQGNSATVLPMTFEFLQTVSFALLAPTTTTIGNGGHASFAFSLRNTGNQPVSFHLVGSPSTWSFAFTPSNVTLQATAPFNQVGGQVLVTVPAGTPVSHPPVVLEAILNGATPTIVGTATPDPTITILPTVGIVAGSFPPSHASVGPTSATVPFYVTNTGTAQEGVAVAVQNSQNLAALGWTAHIYSGTSPITGGSISLAPAANQTLSVKLSSPGNFAVPPGNVVVSLSILGGTMPFSTTVTVPVPSLHVTANSTTTFVTGPSVGSPSPYPDWLVPVLSFVPAIAVVVAVLVYRWNKSRRWTRK